MLDHGRGAPSHVIVCIQQEERTRRERASADGVHPVESFPAQPLHPVVYFGEMATLSPRLVVVDDERATRSGEGLQLCQADALAPAHRAEAIAGRLQAVVRIDED
ncbi:hypothetical protein D9599_27370 [Roseomonas sp. KE2513]|nr:hypothetical protein [Roseomonas sp. KE2513]